jgi:aerotaxis receptor
MGNMSLEHIIGDYKEYVLQHFNSAPRTIYVTQLETPFPAGKLIVSRTDLEGNITHMNQAFIDISGYSESELIRQPHAILRHPDMPKAIFKEIWDTASAGKKWDGYVKNLRKDGGFYWVHATVIANIRDGKMMGLSSIRRQASISKIAEAEVLYKKMLEQESS